MAAGVLLAGVLPAGVLLAGVLLAGVLAAQDSVLSILVPALGLRDLLVRDFFGATLVLRAFVFMVIP